MKRNAASRMALGDEAPLSGRQPICPANLYRCCFHGKEARARGISVLVGDPGRTYFPKDGLIKLAQYQVPTSMTSGDDTI